MSRRIVVDIETDDLDATRIWVIVCKDLDTGERFIFKEPDKDKDEFIAFARTVKVWVGFNILGFDGPVINRLIAPDVVDYRSVIDLLVVARLLDYDIEGGNSLAAWGRRLGTYKDDFKRFKDFMEVYEEGLAYCIQDVEVTEKVYRKLEKYIVSNLWREALRLEHDMAIICIGMNQDGFAFDIDSARALHRRVLDRLSVLNDNLQHAFPPRSKLIKEITPKETKHGTIHRGDFRWVHDGDLSPFTVGWTFSRIEFVPFNPGSPKQRIEVLNAAGWRPYEKTKGYLHAERDYRSLRFKRMSKKEREAEQTRLEEKLKHYETYGWTCSEANLATLPEDAPQAARELAEWLLLDSRRSTLEEWFNAFSESDGRIHGRFNHIGAWTHRMSHAAPNMANIPAGNSLYATEMRSLWTVPRDRLLVGVDADGIQLRVLAHYMNDPKFIEAILNGDKNKGTDMHSMNRRALGEDICKSRDDAKTFIYAWLLGAGIGKVAQILGCTTEEARQANENFLNYYPGLRRLKDEVIPSDAVSGYFQGFDGRLVKCEDEHFMLAGYLQNGESTIMKRATRMWKSELDKAKLPYILVDFVHDEWQSETIHDVDVAVEIAKIQADSIRKVGEELGLNCPLAGAIHSEHGIFADPSDPSGKLKYSIGYNWSHTH